jgi:hypothetical protein
MVGARSVKRDKVASTPAIISFDMDNSPTNQGEEK